MIKEITPRLLHGLLQSRTAESHKYDYGNALLVAGSYGMIGAALLCARACMRSGVGLLTVRVPRCGYDIIQTGIPEAKCETDERHDRHSHICISPKTDAIALGPGMGQHQETQDAIRRMLEQGWDTPGLPAPALVCDADALNCLARNPDLLGLLPHDTILTPHPGETRRLLDATGMSNCTELAMHYRIVVINKTHSTTIHLPDGITWKNELWGNPGMAVGGSGDTLTGILLGLRAQGYSARDAAILGVSLHAIAADMAIEEGEQSEESLLPSDITRWLGRAFAYVASDASDA